MITQSWLDALPVGILITDAELRLLQVNSWLADRLPGAGDLLGRPLAEAFPELVERSLMAAYELTLREGRPTHLPSSLHSYFVRLPAEASTGLEAMPQSATIAPLRAEGRIIGSLTFIEDVSQRLLTERHLQREIDKMTALHEVDRALATLDLQACLETIVDRTRSLFEVEASALFLIEGEQLVAAAVAGVDHASVGRTMPISRGIVGWAALHRQPVLASDVARDGRYFAYDADSRSEMAAPLLLQGDCLGVINVESGRANAFSIANMETLEWLAARAAAAIHNARLHAAEWEQRTLVDSLRNIGLILATELNPDAILDTLLDQVAQVVPYDTASVMLLDSFTGRVRIARHRGYERFGVLQLVAEFDVPLADMHNLAIMTANMRPRVVPRTRADPHWAATELAAHIESWAGAPIVARGRVLGLLSLDKTEPGFYTLDMAERLAAFAAQAGLALENARLYAEQQKLAVTDSLTGIANRRYFDQELARELQRAGRFRRSTALIMLDLDDFKNYNDRFGHPMGDELLRAIAVLLSQSVRSIDTTARYGGEEFVLILPECDSSAACATAERLRELVAKLPLLPGLPASNVQPERVTISLGVALAPVHAGTSASLVQAADDALYAAKRAGKNRVVLFHGPTIEPQLSTASAAD
jgi:diguanylate cyclase (GGDEF)-like protein